MCILGNTLSDILYLKFIRCKRRRSALFNWLGYIFVFGFIFTAILQGYVEIHLDKLIESNNLRASKSNDDHHQQVTDIHTSKKLEDLFNAVHDNRLAIHRELESAEVTRLTKLHEKEIELAEKIAELKEKRKQERNSSEEVDVEDEIDKQFTPMYVDRNLMIKYIKLEKQKLAKRINSIKTIKDVANTTDLNPLPGIWDWYHFKTNEFHFPNDTAVINRVLNVMANSPIVSAREKSRGTQMKIALKFDDDTEAILKPMRQNRDYETLADHYYFSDYERHNAEIAAFHLDRLLKFYRVPPTVGRRFKLATDIWMQAEKYFARKFFFSPAGNVCLTMECTYYCDTNHALCGDPFDYIEGSVQLMIARHPQITWYSEATPFRRTYSKRNIHAEWEKNENYCVAKVFQDVLFQSRHMLDLVDAAIFDFLTGNMDRHNFEFFDDLGNSSFHFHLDNGRGFGRPDHDEMSILAPLTQCCLVRHSTFMRLKKLHEQKLSKLMDESLKADPLYPILKEGHLKALDRRLVKILLAIDKCANRFTIAQTIIDDGY